MGRREDRRRHLAAAHIQLGLGPLQSLLADPLFVGLGENVLDRHRSLGQDFQEEILGFRAGALRLGLPQGGEDFIEAAGDSTNYRVYSKNGSSRVLAS
jgi:hypothetical protein